MSTKITGHGDVLDPPSDVAIRLSVDQSTLAQWRWRGTGPDYVKVGGLVRYPRSAVDRWIQSRTVTSRRTPA